MTKILIPSVLIFLAFVIAKQFKPDESELATVQAISRNPIQIVHQMPREPIEYGKYRVMKTKNEIVSNQPLSFKTQKSMMSGGNIRYDFLNLRDDYTKDYMLGLSAN